MSEVKKLIIIGSGPSGWTAAIYAARAEVKPLLFEGKEPGGQLMGTTEVENFPGFPKGILGPELMKVMKEQAVRFGTEVVNDVIERVDFSARPFKVWSAKGVEYQSEAVIISTGATAKWLGVPGEDRLKGRGVSACATCDGFFFKGKNVAIVGGGDAAMEEANFLTRFANSVTVYVRTDVLRASKIMQERTLKNPKIVLAWNTEVKEVLGEERMVGLKIFNNQTNETTEVAMDGLFVAIGHSPNTEIFKEQLDRDDVKGYLIVKPGSTETNVPGVFAAGDVVDYKYRQAITAAGDGCRAAIDAEKYLASRE